MSKVILKYVANWIIPQKGECISGILEVFEDGSSELELIGSFGSLNYYPIIIGITSSGRKITLYNCYATNRAFSSGGFKTEKLTVNIVFDGVHFENKDELKFNEVMVNYSNLEEWFGVNNIKVESDDNKENFTATAKYYSEGSPEVEVADNIKLKIKNFTKFPSRKLVQIDANFKEESFISIYSDSLIDFFECMDIHNCMRNFLSLGVGNPVDIRNIKGVIYKEGTRNIIVNIYFKELKNKCRELIPSQMLFDYNEIRCNFIDYITNWYSKYNKLNDIFSLYFSAIYNNYLYISNKFLQYTQALESYHRRVRNNEVKVDEEYIKNREAVLDILKGTEYCDWLCNVLEVKNEPTFRGRLQELLSENKELLNTSKTKIKSFVNKIYETRNYYTHFDEKKRARALSGEDLYKATCVLEIIIKSCIMREIGFSYEEVKKLLNQDIIKLNMRGVMSIL